MPELSTTPAYQLTATEKVEIVTQLSQSIVNSNTPINISDTAKSDIISEISNQFSTGVLSMPISDEDKADIIAEVLAELYAKSQDTSTLTKVSDLTGVTSIPAVKNDTDIVAVPLGLLTTNKPIEVDGQEAIYILVAQGKIVDSQIYFTPVEDE